MCSFPSGAGSRHSDTRERTSDTTDDPTRTSRAAHRHGAPETSPIATPSFPEEQRRAKAPDQHGTPCVPSHPAPDPGTPTPRNAPAAPPTVPRAPPGLRTDREHQKRALSPLPRFPRRSGGRKLPTNTERHVFLPIRRRRRALRDQGTHQRHHRRSHAHLPGCAPTGSTRNEPYRRSLISRGAATGESSRPTWNAMCSFPSGAGSGHSDTRKRSSDTTDCPTRTSRAAHQQGAPETSPIAAPSFSEEQRRAKDPDQHGTP